MDDEKKKIAAECWKKGSEAMAKEQWDFAIVMFGQSTALIPSNLMYRQTLRGVECKKYNNNKTGAKMAGMKLMGTRAKIKKAKIKKDWQTVERAAEAGLAVNPWDAQLNADLGQACRKLDFQEVAKFAYEYAVAGNPESKVYNRALAELLEERGDYLEAVKCWQRILKIDPLDGEARSKIMQLGATSVIDRGGYGDAETTRDVKKTAYDLDRPARTSVPGAVDGPGVSLEADLQRAIRKDESNTDNYLKLAEFYKREKRLSEAADTLNTALQVSGGDQNIRELMEDIELDQMRNNLALARGAARKNDEDQTASKNVAALAQELLTREIRVLQSRVERYSQDTRVKYELAKRLMRKKQWADSIKLLQSAANDPRLECEVAIALSDCFIKEKKTALAKRQLQRAVENEKLTHHDRPDLFKKAHYGLGRLCEQDGQREQAENHYNEILAVEYEYRDTLQRLEKLQAGDGNPSEDQ